jgi:heme/copper-type cytochrome/quinol oxidase subunit 2
MVLAVALALGSPASACPNCKEALAAQTGEGARLKDGYYYSIVMMMGMPFALLGTGAFFVVRAVKKGALPEL